METTIKTIRQDMEKVLKEFNTLNTFCKENSIKFIIRPEVTFSNFILTQEVDTLILRHMSQEIIKVL